MTKQFQIPPIADETFHRTAFLAFLSEYARMSAKGRRAETAFKNAKRTIERLGLSATEQSGFDDLLREFRGNFHQETSFYLGGKNLTAEVYWLADDKFPTVRSKQ